MAIEFSSSRAGYLNPASVVKHRIREEMRGAAEEVEVVIYDELVCEAHPDPRNTRAVQDCEEAYRRGVCVSRSVYYVNRSDLPPPE